MDWYSCESCLEYQRREALILPRSLDPDSAEAKKHCPHCSWEADLAVQRKTSPNSPSSHWCCGHTYSLLESTKCFPLPPFFPFLSKAQGKVRAKNSILLALHEKSWWASCWLLYLSFRQDGSRYSWAIAVNKNNVLLWKLLPHQQAKCYWKKIFYDSKYLAQNL